MWISVEERLPEKAGEYLVIHEYFPQLGTRRSIARLLPHKPAVKPRGYDPHFYIKGKVLYWMEIPENPKGI